MTTNEIRAEIDSLPMAIEFAEQLAYEYAFLESFAVWEVTLVHQTQIVAMDTKKP